MKYILIFIVILLSVVGGFLFFSNTEEITPTENQAETPSAQTISGVVTAVNLDGVAVDGPGLITVTDAGDQEHTIAVPSMGIRLCAAYENIADMWNITPGDRVAVLGEQNDDGQIVPCESDEHFLRVISTYEDSVLGYTFSYSKGPNGYVLISDEESSANNFLDGVSLFNQTEYEEFQNSTDVREGPPAIHVRVYDNVDNESAAVWTMSNSQETNYELALTEPTEAVVGGANAINFVADGLWPIDTYVVAHDSKMYVLMGMISDDRAQMQLDFKDMVASFEFIPVVNAN